MISASRGSRPGSSSYTLVGISVLDTTDAETRVTLRYVAHWKTDDAPPEESA